MSKEFYFFISCIQILCSPRHLIVTLSLNTSFSTTNQSFAGGDYKFSEIIT